jgi:GntP family gluconate:H+ symporter
MSTILIFIVAILIMVLAISRWKIHPFLAIIATALLLAVVLGVPLKTIPDVIGKGFSSIFTGIGLVIIFGTIIGTVLEKTGAAVAMARGVERVVGQRFPRLAMMLIGWIVSIPVFCDSGFVLVSPIGKSLARRTSHPQASLMLALGAGLFASHVFIPPTPGPVAAAGMMGLDDNLLLVIAVGVVISLISLVPAYFFAGKIGKKITTIGVNLDEDNKTQNERYPSATLSFLPIIVPVLLMAMGSVASLVAMPEWLATVFAFLGKPVIALMVAFLCCLPLLAKRKLLKQSYGIINDSLMTAGPIIFITAAGSVLGSVIVESGFVEIIKQYTGTLSVLGVIFPFIIAAILKSAQGSSTVAITTTASLMGLFSDSSSMMHALGYTTPLAATLVVMAIGAGAMTVSHANDSYFWVVTGFGGIRTTDGYRSFTLMTLIMGVTAITAIALAALILM